MSAIEDESGLSILPPIRTWLDGEGAAPTVLRAGGRNARLAIAEDAPATLGALAEAARAAFTGLGLRDYARFDFRIDAAGRAVLLDANALPGLHPALSPFMLAANAGGWSCHRLYAHLAGRALARAAG